MLDMFVNEKNYDFVKVFGYLYFLDLAVIA